MKTYAVPFLLWVVAIVGLVMMLLLDSGAGDAAGLLLLCTPLAIVLRYGLVAR